MDVGTSDGQQLDVESLSDYASLASRIVDRLKELKEEIELRIHCGAGERTIDGAEYVKTALEVFSMRSQEGNEAMTTAHLQNLGVELDKLKKIEGALSEVYKVRSKLAARYAKREAEAQETGGTLPPPLGICTYYLYFIGKMMVSSLVLFCLFLKYSSMGAFSSTSREVDEKLNYAIKEIWSLESRLVGLGL